MPVAPFVPLISTGISAAGSYFSGRKKKKEQEAAQRNLTAQQQPLIQGATTAAQTLTGMGRDQYNRGAGATEQGQSYYERILKGNRSELTQHLAPEIAATTDLYRGAEKNLERSGMQGAQRDVATAELNRDRVGKTASLVSGARSGAAAALTDIGAQGTAAGINATSGGAGIYGQLLGNLQGLQESNLRQTMYGDQQSQALWSQIGKMLVGSYDAFSGGGSRPNANASVAR